MLCYDFPGFREKIGHNYFKELSIDAGFQQLVKITDWHMNKKLHSQKPRIRSLLLFLRYKIVADIREGEIFQTIFMSIERSCQIFTGEKDPKLSFGGKEAH